MGKILQDEIVCPYHGFRYNVKGECTLVPSMQRPPQSLRVDTYPTIEHGPFIWIWIGNSAEADTAILPSIVPQADYNRANITGYHPTSCDFSLIHENIADTEHTTYLHGETIGNGARIEFRKAGKIHGVMDIEPRKITFLSNARDMPPSNFDVALWGPEQTDSINISTSAVFTAPGYFSAELEWTRGNPGIASQPIKAIYIWCATPISANSCHFWWDLRFNGPVRNPDAIKTIWSQVIERTSTSLKGYRNQ